MRPGVWCMWLFSPTASSIFAARLRRTDRRTPRYISGAATLSSALWVGNRLKDWNTKPMFFSRKRTRSFSFMRSMRFPATRIDPPEGFSSPAIMFSSVDLPEPERPMMQANSPGQICRLTPSSARSFVPPSE